MIEEQYSLSRIAAGELNPVKERMMEEMKRHLPGTDFTVRFEWNQYEHDGDTYLTLVARVQRLVVHPEDELTA